jgi:membrane-associated phospholipid phosphatase
MKIFQPAGSEIIFTEKKENTLYNLIKSNQYFFIPYALFLTIGVVILISYGKGDVLLWINQFHNPFWDTFFYYVTLIGDGWFVGLMLIPLGFIRISYSIQVLASYLTTGALVQILKRIFDLPRPLKYFGDAVVLNFVEGIKVFSNHSFPSGHSASAFSIFLVAAILVKNKVWGIVFFVCALIVAFSRVYTVQHFFIDIYFGSLIGVIFTLLTYRLIEIIGISKRIKWLVETK